MVKPASPESRRGDAVVGARIKNRREELDMSRRELAERAGVSYPYLSQLETGYRNASYRHQLAIARELGASLDDLFAAEGMRGSPSSEQPTPDADLDGEPTDLGPAAEAPGRPTLNRVVDVAVSAIETLPSRVRVDALNQIQLRVMRSLISGSQIESLRPGEVFVFGSNAFGYHDGGAARQAYDKFGAVWGEGHGHHGDSYAIDTMSGLSTLTAEVATFLDYARRHPELRFLLTPLGTGIAGYRVDQIAPLFADAPDNVVLPAEFRMLLDEQG